MMADNADNNEDDETADADDDVDNGDGAVRKGSMSNNSPGYLSGHNNKTSYQNGEWHVETAG